MKSLFDSPSPPNPMDTARAQSSADVSSSLAQIMLNQQNQQTPWGSLTYNQTGSQTYHDPLLDKDVTLPRFTATQSLTPEQQTLLNQQNTFDKMFNDIALQQTGAMGSHLSQPFDYKAGDYEKWAGDLYDTLNKDTVERGQQAMDQKLANQGLQAGSTAYDDAQKNLITSQMRDRTGFLLDAYNTGLSTAKLMRDQPINEITALMSGGQVTPPNFISTPQASFQAPDIAGMINNNFNQTNASRNAMIGGLSGLGGAVAGGWASRPA